MFRNNDSSPAPHRDGRRVGRFGDIAPGATSRGFTVRSGSALNFHCTLHSSMVGSINGANAPDPPPCNDPYGC